MTSQTPDSARTDDLVVRHLPLAYSLARRFDGRGETLEDLRGVAQLALVGAAGRFDPGRGVAFSTFAQASILGELKRHLRDRVWWVRPPRPVHDLTLQIGEARETLSHRLGRTARVSEIAEYLHFDEASVWEAMQADGGYRFTSLDTSMGADGQPHIDLLGGEDPEYDVHLDRVSLGQALASLSGDDRDLIRRHYIDNHTQRSIGTELGCSQMQVSRLLERALTRLRSQMTARPVSAAS